MTGEEFVKKVYAEKEQLKKEFLSEDSQSSVALIIRKLVSDGAAKEQLSELVEQLLTDTYYDLLLGLDGASSLGDTQQEYKIYDEAGELLNECGDIEAAAYKIFYEKDFE